MGFGGISMWQLLIILLIVVVIFGTKKLGSIGSDLGGALKGFRKAMNDADSERDTPQIGQQEREQPDAQFSAEEQDAQRKRSG